MLSFSDVLTGARFSLGVVLLSAGLIGLVLSGRLEISAAAVARRR